MPKVEFSHEAGQPLSVELRELVERFFGNKGVGRLERLGGKMIISLTTPYTSRKKGNKDSTIIDDSFVSSLQLLRDKPEELKMQIVQLSVKKLRELAKLIGYPVRTKSARQEVVEELVRHFYSEEVWRRIAGTV
ncbi:MAG: hypothetical protein ABSA71_07995 [Desulfomonilia bacterium]|jgi:hypothetical protein